MPLTATAFTYVLLPTPGAIVTAAGVNVNVGEGPRSRIENRIRITRVRAELNNASSGAAYPTSGGIPFSSTPGDWGMQRNLDYIVVYGFGHTGTGPARHPVWKYNPTAHSMVGHWSPPTTHSGSTEFPELATTWTPTVAGVSPVFFCKAYGW